MKPFRIGFVVPDDSTAWLYYHHLIEVLLEAGAELTVLSAPGPFVPRFRAIGVNHIAVPYERFVSPLHDISLIRELRRAFILQRFDVVQNFTVKANLYGALAAIRAGIPTIINTVEGAGILWSDSRSPRIRFLRAIVEAGLRYVRPKVFRYWFVNAYDRNLFLERGLALRERSVIAISTGVDTAEFNPKAISNGEIESFRRELEIPPGVPVITMVAGRLLRSKGVETFLYVARRLRDAGIAGQAVLIGPEDPGHPDALDPSIVHRAADDGLVRWTGFRNDIAAIYASSDVVVVPTAYAEGIAKSVVEPMAMAKPVVCFRTPAIEEMVRPGIDSILAAQGDADELFNGVVELLLSPRRRTEIGWAAQEAARARFDARKQAERAVARVYGDLPGWPPRRSTTTKGAA